jgi:hypothetical protein
VCCRHSVKELFDISGHAYMKIVSKIVSGKQLDIPWWPCWFRYPQTLQSKFKNARIDVSCLFRTSRAVYHKQWNYYQAQDYISRSDQPTKQTTHQTLNFSISVIQNIFTKSPRLDTIISQLPPPRFITIYIPNIYHNIILRFLHTVPCLILHLGNLGVWWHAWHSVFHYGARWLQL